MSDNECFKQLYTQYIETQKQCGEDTNKFTLEQFVSRLAREKDNYKKRKGKTTWLLLSPSVLFHCFLDWLEQQAGEMWESLAVDTPLE